MANPNEGPIAFREEQAGVGQLFTLELRMSDCESRIL